jgi:TetR/AcrR family transcriptional regulator
VATKDRVLSVAAVLFAERGYEAVSLDALATELGVTKQTILYHFGSKAGLLDAVLADATHRLVGALEPAVAGARPGWPRVEAVVRATFALAVRQPELIGLLREVSRLGPPASTGVIAGLQPLVDRAVAALDQGMDAGAFRRADARLVLVSAYATVTGVVSDAEALRAVGLELDLRRAAALRRTLLQFLRTALVADDDRPPGGEPTGPHPIQ